MKIKTYQYVVTSALKEKVLKDVHDEAGRDVRSILPGSGSVGVKWNKTSALLLLCVQQVSRTLAKGTTGESQDL